MSRIIVKNLPPNFGKDPDKLRELFSSQGLVTDVQLKYAHDGIFRKFAFVGFQNGVQAQNAIKNFNKSFINTSRIQVEVATDLKDTSKPRSWSKYSKDSSAYQKSHGINQGNEIKEQTNLANNNDSQKCEKHVKRKRRDSGVEIEDINNTAKEDDIMAHPSKPAPQISDKEYMLAKMKRLRGESNDPTSAPTPKSPRTLEDNSPKITDSPMPSPAEKMDVAPKPIHPPGIDESRGTYVVKVSNLPRNTNKKQVTKIFSPRVPSKIALVKDGVGRPASTDQGSNEGKEPKKSFGQIKFALVTFETLEDFAAALALSKTFYRNRFLEIEAHSQPHTTKNGRRRPPDPKNGRTSAGDLLKSTSLQPVISNDMAPPPPPVSETGRIFLRNLPYVCTEDDIEKLFIKYGPLTEVNLPIDRATKRPKGFGFVTFVMPENAEAAFMELDGSVFMGRMLHLIPAQEAPTLPSSHTDGGDDLGDGGWPRADTSTRSTTTTTVGAGAPDYKSRSEREKKESATKVTHNWNTLFVNPNAVAEAMSERYSVSKREILNDVTARTKNSVAVRLALGETEIVNETRTFLIENGVNLESFGGTVASNKADRPRRIVRSKTILLIKNLPAGVRMEELKAPFEKHGEIRRLIMPPYGLTALIEFVLAQEARKAFRSLTYTRFKGMPLYLEWAPEDCLTSSLPPPSSSGEEGPTLGVTKPQEHHADESIIESGGGTTIFVKNLNFSSTENDLRELFCKFGHLESVKIATKRHPYEPSKSLSAGYGFVTFRSRSEAEEALKELQSHTLADHGLELSLSRSAKERDSVVGSRHSVTKNKNRAPGSGDCSSTKILVRNVPFQAKLAEIRELFAPFGPLETVRMPKKMTAQNVGGDRGNNSTHKGFAFVEYSDAGSARRAYQTLSQSTHLYGRRLVLEWAIAETTKESPLVSANLAAVKESDDNYNPFPRMKTV